MHHLYGNSIGRIILFKRAFLSIGISQLKSAMEIVIEKVLAIQATMEEVDTRLNCLEESHKKQKVFNKFIKKHINQSNESLKNCSTSRTILSQAKLLNDQTSKSASNSAAKVRHNLGGKPNETNATRTKVKRKRQPKLAKLPKFKIDQRKKKTTRVIKSGLPLTIHSSLSQHNVAPLASPIHYLKKNAYALPSSEIDHSSLSSVDEVLQKYDYCIREGKVSLLAVKLAQEALIGEKVMRRCSPKGCSKHPALPVDSLYAVKQAVLTAFPQFWNKLGRFEKIWRDCEQELGLVCYRYRMRLHDDKDLTEQQLEPPPSVATIPSTPLALGASPMPSQSNSEPTPPEPNLATPSVVSQASLPSQSGTPVAVNDIRPTLMLPSPQLTPPAVEMLQPRHTPLSVAMEEHSSSSMPVIISHSSSGSFPAAMAKESQPRNSPPTANPVCNVINPLPSSEVVTDGLMSINTFLSLHATPIKTGKYTLSQLCRKLAAQCIFSKDVLMKCTPCGAGPIHHGLPIAQMNLLKQVLLECFPHYWNNLVEYEEDWTKICLQRLSALCCEARSSAKKEWLEC